MRLRLALAVRLVRREQTRLVATGATLFLVRLLASAVVAVVVPTALGLPETLVGRVVRPHSLSRRALAQWGKVLLVPQHREALTAPLITVRVVVVVQALLAR
jgi:hypothetical protein